MTLCLVLRFYVLYFLSLTLYYPLLSSGLLRFLLLSSALVPLPLLLSSFPSLLSSTLSGYCESITWQRPQNQQIIPRLQAIARAENLDIGISLRRLLVLMLLLHDFCFVYYASVSFSNTNSFFIHTFLLFFSIPSHPRNLPTILLLLLSLCTRQREPGKNL